MAHRPEGRLTLEDLRAQREGILRLAAARGAHRVRVLGSVARGDARADGDVDFLVELDPDRTVLDLSSSSSIWKQRLAEANKLFTGLMAKGLGRTLPGTPAWPDIETLINEEIAAVRRGERAAATFAREITPRIDQRLKAAQ